MSYEQNVEQKISYEYDFAVDGGDVGSIGLREFAVNKLKAGLIVKKAIIHVETALVSGAGSATIGDGTDDDGFFVDLVGVAAGSYSSLDASQGGALLKNNDTNSLEAELMYEVDADTLPQLVIGTGALTAGKFKIDFLCYQK